VEDNASEFEAVEEPIEKRLYRIEESLALIANSLDAIEQFMTEFAPLARKAAELMSKTPAQAVRQALKRGKSA
jgi:hypothetical protein